MCLGAGCSGSTEVVAPEDYEEAVDDFLDRGCESFKLSAESLIESFTEDNDRPPAEWNELVPDYAEATLPVWIFETGEDGSIELTPDPDGTCANFTG